MFEIDQSNPDSAVAPAVKDIFPGLSTRWLNLDWNQLEPAQRQFAARLITLGAAQVRLRCTIHKENAPPPLLATVVASGNYWTPLTAKLATLAQDATAWQRRAGAVHIETAKVGLRRMAAHQEEWRSEVLSPSEFWESATAAPAALEFEECRFADGTPFPGGALDPRHEAEVAWTLGDSAGQHALSCHAAARVPCTPPPKRSWKQAELDAAIGEYRDDPAHEFVSLRDLVQSGSPQAYARAKTIFGRNAIVRHLGVRGAAMVSRSPVWQALAADLDLPRGRCKPLPLRSFGIIPMDQALEARATAEGGSVLDEVVQSEARNQIDQLVRQAALRFRRAAEAERFAKHIESVKVSIDCGNVTPEQAVLLTNLVIQQALDGQTLRIRQRP